MMLLLLESMHKNKEYPTGYSDFYFSYVSIYPHSPPQFSTIKRKHVVFLEAALKACLHLKSERTLHVHPASDMHHLHLPALQWWRLQMHDSRYREIRGVNEKWPVSTQV